MLISKEFFVCPQPGRAETQKEPCLSVHKIPDPHFSFPVYEGYETNKNGEAIFKCCGYIPGPQRGNCDGKGSTTVILGSTTFDYLHPPTPVYGLQAYLQAYLQAH
jgi:hypothetical protein